MTQLGYADSEGCARQWARSLELPFVGERVFFGKPKGATLPPAWVQIKLVDTPVVEREVVPIATSSLQWDVFARRKGDAWSIVSTLELAIKLLHTGSPFGDAATVSGTEIVLGPLWRPDEDGDFACYVLGSLIELRPRVVVPA